MRLIFLLVVTLVQNPCKALYDGVVNINCGTLDDNVAQLSYFGETLQVSAFMHNGRKCVFKQDIATATWTLTVALKETNDTRCIMTKIPHRHIYSIDVVSFRRSADFESEDDEKFLMECNFETYKEEIEDSLSLDDGSLSSPHVIETHQGKKSTSDYTISVVNSEGHKLIAMELGRVARLKVTMTPTEEERGKGFMPLKCEVMTPDKKQVSVILSNGCGTGYPFHQDKGFKMQETTGLSPPFRVFRLNPKLGVIFKCSFVTCNGDCLGSTCPTERLTEDRNKRALPQSDVLNSANTHPQNIQDDSMDPDLIHMSDQRHAHVVSGDVHVAQQVTEDLAEEVQPFEARGQKIDLILNPEQIAAWSAQGSPNRQRVFLIGEVDAHAFTRTIKLAVLGTSTFVLVVFVLLTLYICVKVRRISQ